MVHLSGPAPRGLTLNDDGSFTFVAAGVGDWTFSYYITNADGTSGIATVTITVDPRSRGGGGGRQY